MAGFLDTFRQKVVASVWKETPDASRIKNIDDRIALGVLLWAVAEADEKFLPQETVEIAEILKKHSQLSEEELLVIMRSIQEAAEQRVDLQRFTREISANLDYRMRISLIEELFRVACADDDLDDRELEVIRKISGLFHLAHKDFIDTKIRIKKECGLDTVDI
jgi:uncharacterized tellurite resistance protein B-like protein